MGSLTTTTTGLPRPGSCSDQAHTIIAQAQGNRVTIQDYIPLADSIEWQLGQRYLQEHGSQAFLGDARPVPYVVNNDGTLSRYAAEVLLARLAETEQAGPLEPDLFVLELGIGVGLFARYFLDAFRDLCEQHDKDYYHRLTYIAADRSEAMLRDACRHGIFAQHPGRYRLRVVGKKRGQRELFLKKVRSRLFFAMLSVPALKIEKKG